MTAKQIEMRQLEQLVQGQSQKQSFVNLRKLSFNLEETNKLREDLRKIEESLRKAKPEQFLAQDELEQYQRRSNLRVFGVPESEKEDTDSLVLDVVHNKLQLPHVNIIEIDRSHRVGAKKTSVPHAKRFLAKSGVTIREDLAMERPALLNVAIGKYGLHNVWTADGRIVVKSGARHFQISRSEELKTADPATRGFQRVPPPQLTLRRALATLFLPILTVYRLVAHINSESLMRHIDELNSDAALMQWHEINVIDTLDEKIFRFSQMITDLYNRTVPLRTRRLTKPLAPWLTNDTVQLMRKRENAYSRYKRDIRTNVPCS
ncbi:hypothetical protein PR048_000642 [Dryococelus australis]|uniref:Reverse transcriptase n=1 Tax=Dryococelus australis TaxID=614101 RepID=A0ABQ9IF85_9NEOP|nr:hypothetical protein PR048_000642 [Dryococelus australis]